jgi:hypothetical protein
MARFELNKTSKPFVVFKSEKITTNSADNFFTWSLLVGCFAMRDHFYWQKQKIHNNVYWNMSDLVAKSIIVAMASVAVIGFLILIGRMTLFIIRPKRIERMKAKMDQLLENQEKDSALNTVIFFLMGGLMAAFSLKYIGFSLATATGFGVATNHVYRVHVKTPKAETMSNR